MKFAIFTHLPWPEGRDQRQLLLETAQQVQHADELGFHGAWVAEHHFTRYGLGASSLLVLSSIASQTKRIRLGTAVLVPTLHHPLRLAEDVATLDVISGGRVDVGFGRGAVGYEYDGYCVDGAESQARFQENIRMIQGIWTTPEFTCQGQFTRVNRVNLVPSPIQKPHPPMYIAATRTPATLEFVVSTGHPLIVGVVLDHADALDLARRFVAMSAAAGRHVPMSQIPYFRYFYVAETEQQARKDTEPALAWTMDLLQFRRQFDQGSEVHHRLEDWRRTRTELPTSYDYLFQRRAIIGTPEKCVAAIKDLQAQGIQYFGCNFDFGAMEHRKVLRSMDLFAREVMPHFSH